MFWWHTWSVTLTLVVGLTIIGTGTPGLIRRAASGVVGV